LRTDKTQEVGKKIYFVPTDKQRWEVFNSTLFAATGSDGEFETSGAPGEYFIVFTEDFDFKAEEGKNAIEKMRAWLEKKTKNAQKVILKAKEIEKITLTLPENQ